MTRTCARCGTPFEAQRSTRKYCSGNCRARQSIAPQAPPPVVRQPGKQRRPMSRVAGEARKELAKAQRLSTSAGQSALLLAQRLDHAEGESGAAVASLAREFAAAMDRALRNVAEPDQTAKYQQRSDEVAAARKRKARSGDSAAR